MKGAEGTGARDEETGDEEAGTGGIGDLEAGFGKPFVSH